MIQRSLNAKETLIKTRDYPCLFESQGGKRVLLGIGGNIGDVVRRFEHLLVFLNRSSFLKVIESSPILKNPPFGYTQQDDFYNALLLIETSLAPKVLLRYCLDAERHFGRKRSFQDAPRTLDIDMIFYEGVTMQTKRLSLPHPYWSKRSSVLTPLSSMRRFVS